MVRSGLGFDSVRGLSRLDYSSLAPAKSTTAAATVSSVTVWVVRHGEDLYVRSVNGRTSSCFRGAQVRHEAHIEAGGVDKDVPLIETGDMDDEIDACQARVKPKRPSHATRPPRR
jgi:hypothetical protein